MPPEWPNRLQTIAVCSAIHHERRKAGDLLIPEIEIYSNVFYANSTLRALKRPSARNREPRIGGLKLMANF